MPGNALANGHCQRAVRQSIRIRHVCYASSWLKNPNVFNYFLALSGGFLPICSLKTVSRAFLERCLLSCANGAISPKGATMIHFRHVLPALMLFATATVQAETIFQLRDSPLNGTKSRLILPATNLDRSAGSANQIPTLLLSRVPNDGPFMLEPATLSFAIGEVSDQHEVLKTVAGTGVGSPTPTQTERSLPPAVSAVPEPSTILTRGVGLGCDLELQLSSPESKPPRPLNSASPKNEKARNNIRAFSSSALKLQSRAMRR